jgi:hypothetical protein
VSYIWGLGIHKTMNLVECVAWMAQITCLQNSTEHEVIGTDPPERIENEFLLKWNWRFSKMSTFHGHNVFSH